MNLRILFVQRKKGLSQLGATFLTYYDTLGNWGRLKVNHISNVERRLKFDQPEAHLHLINYFYSSRIYN